MKSHFIHCQQCNVEYHSQHREALKYSVSLRTNNTMMYAYLLKIVPLKLCTNLINSFHLVKSKSVLSPKFKFSGFLEHLD